MCVNNIIVSCEDCCSWQTHKCSGLILYYLVDLQILNITIWLFSIYVMSYDLVLCKNHCFFCWSHSYLNGYYYAWNLSSAEVFFLADSSYYNLSYSLCLKSVPLLKFWQICIMSEICPIVEVLTDLYYVWNLSHCWSSDRFVLRLLPCLTILTYICLYVWHVWRRRMYECLICVMLPMFIASNMCKIYFLFTAIFVLFCPAMICVHSYVSIPMCSLSGVHFLRWDKYSWDWYIFVLE